MTRTVPQLRPRGVMDLTLRPIGCNIEEQEDFGRPTGRPPTRLHAARAKAAGIPGGGEVDELCDSVSAGSVGAVLVIEDELGIVDFLQRGLTSYGYMVITAVDGVDGAVKAVREPVDLVVLDMMLRGRSGMDVLASIRERRPALPVIGLTAQRDIDDRIAGLEAGLIDYLTKPFSLRELAARIRAQLRAVSQVASTKLVGGDLELDLLTRKVRSGGQFVRLSSTEFELLTYLLRNPNRVLTREEILRAVWGYDHDPGTNVVDVYVGYLRRKLRQGEGSVPIVTLRRIGFRFDADLASLDRDSAGS